MKGKKRRKERKETGPFQHLLEKSFVILPNWVSGAFIAISEIAIKLQGRVNSLPVKLTRETKTTPK